MLREIDSDELTDWIAFTRIYPLPDRYLISAQICQTIANRHRGQGEKLWTVDDFMPHSRRPAESEAVKEQRAEFYRMLAEARSKAEHRP